MAYNADIIVRLVETEVDRAVRRIERKLNGLRDVAADVQIGGDVKRTTKELKGLERRVDAINRSFERIKPTAVFGGITAGIAGALGGLEKFGQALKDIPDAGAIFGGLSTSIQQFGDALTQATGPAGQLGASLIDFAQSSPVAAASIAAITGGLIAFAPAVKQGVEDVTRLTGAFGKLIGDLTSKGLITFDRLNEKFELTRKGIIELAKGVGSLSVLKQELKEARKELDEMDRTADNFREGTIRLIEAERNVNNELRERKKIYDELTRAQTQIRENVEASRESRRGSGFAEFSQTIGGTPVQKSIRRQREKLAKRTRGIDAVAAPLMLPSTEMLKAGERGLKRIRSVSDQLNENIDLTNQNARNFVEQLRNGGEVANELPRIFGQVGQSLEVVSGGIESAVQKARFLAGSPAVKEGTELGPETARQAAIRETARLEKSLEEDIERLRLAKDFNRYKRRRKNIRRLAKLQEEADRRRDKFNEDLLLGAGFPLLTGQGPGGVLGGVFGAIQGGGKGGFGAQIFFSAIGAQLDRFIQTLGQAATSIGTNADLLSVLDAAGVKVSGSLQNVIQELEESGQATRAFALSQGELQKAYGPNAVTDLNNFDQANQRLADSVKRITSTILPPIIRIVTAISDITAGAINLFADAVQTVVEAFRFIAGTQGPRDNRRPDFRLVGGFAQGSAFDREVARTALRRLPGEEERGAFKASAFLERYKKQNQLLREQQNIVKQINQIQEQGARERVRRLKEEIAIKKEEIQIERDRNLQEVQGQIASSNLVRQRIALETQLAQNRQNALNVQLNLTRKIADVNEALIEANKQPIFDPNQFKLFQEPIESAALEGQVSEFGSILKKATTKEGGLLFSDKDIKALVTAYKIAIAQEKELQKEEKERQKILKDIQKVQTTEQTVRDYVQPIKDARLEYERSLETQKEYSRLLKEGMLPAEAERISQFNEQVRIQKEQIESALVIAKAELERLNIAGLTTEEYEKQLQKIKDLEDALGGVEKEAAKGSGVKPKTDADIIQERVDELQGELNEMTKLGNVVVQVADNIGAAFSTAFQDVINGSKSTQEALSDMFKTIGESFVKMAAEIIVKQLTMIALQAILKALGGATGSFESAPLGEGFSTGATPSSFDAVGAGIFTPKANGGPVQGGQPYMVGERGPELFVPSTNGGVMRNEDMRQLMGRSPVGAAPQMNFTFETTNIGGQEFVSREQLETAMAVTRRQAANEGAKRGMSMTLDKMQNSPRTRSRIGIS